MAQRLWRASKAGFLAAEGTSFGEPSEAEAEEKEGISRSEAWSNMVLALIGVMICVLPNVMAQCGYLLAPPLLLLAALVLIRMGQLICSACELAEESSGSKAGSLKSYEDLATAVGMYKILMVTKNTVMIACLLVSQSFLAGALVALVPFKISKPMLRWCVVMPMFCVMALLKDLSQLSRFAWLGLLGMATELVGLVVGCLLASLSKRPRSYSILPPEGDLAAMVGVTLSAFIFAFAILATVPSVRSQMQKPEEMPLALRDAILFTLVLYEIIMVWGYFAYGESVDENLVVEISKAFPIFGTVPSLGLFVNVAITTPLFFYCLCTVLEDTGSDAIRTQGTPTNTVGRLLLVLLLTTFGWALPGLLAVIGVFSSVFCVCNNLWFPVLFYYRLRKQAQRPAAALDVAANAAVAILGLLVFIYGLKGSMEELAEEMGWNHSNATNASNVTSNATSDTALWQ